MTNGRVEDMKDFKMETYTRETTFMGELKERAHLPGLMEKYTMVNG